MGRSSPPESHPDRFEIAGEERRLAGRALRPALGLAPVVKVNRATTKTALMNQLELEVDIIR